VGFVLRLSENSTPEQHLIETVEEVWEMVEAVQK
jgi:hypothetical protein